MRLYGRRVTEGRVSKLYSCLASRAAKGVGGEEISHADPTGSDVLQRYQNLVEFTKRGKFIHNLVGGDTSHSSNDQEESGGYKHRLLPFQGPVEGIPGVVNGYLYAFLSFSCSTLLARVSFIFLWWKGRL